jgi:hypothetical protein
MREIAELLRERERRTQGYRAVRQHRRVQELGGQGAGTQELCQASERS